MFPVLPGSDGDDVCSEHRETCGQKGKRQGLYLPPGKLERGTGKDSAVS